MRFVLTIIAVVVLVFIGYNLGQENQGMSQPSSASWQEHSEPPQQSYPVQQFQQQPYQQPPQSYPPFVQQQPQSFEQPAQSQPTQTVSVAHGDIRNPADGRCWVKVFSGQPTGLGSGTYRIQTVIGTPEEIQARVQQISQGSAQHAGMPCPVIS